MADDRRTVVVLGAGISGLVCGYRLKTLGVDVILIEKSERAGGVIRSESVDGFLIERGPGSTQGIEEFVSLVEELGIGDQFVEGDPKAPAFVYFGGRLHAVPNGPAALIKSRLLSTRGKLRLLAEPFIPKRESEAEESVADFARRRVGREFAERVIAPFVSGIYAGDAGRLSVQAAFPRMVALETGYGGLIRGAIAEAREARRAKQLAPSQSRSSGPRKRRLCSFRNGMEFLPATLASRLGEDLITGSSDLCLRAASAPESTSPEFLVEFQSGGIHRRISCDRVVIATPANAAASLVAPVSDELRGLLEEIEYPSLAIACLAYKESDLSNAVHGFGFLAAPSERLSILGCVFNSSLFEGRAPKGKVLLTVFIGGARNPGVVELGDDELAALAHAELQQVLKATGEPEPVAITRHRRAIPQYNLGHARRVQRIDSLIGSLPDLELIGNYLHGVSVGDCVKEADRTARKIASEIEARRV